MAHSRLSRQIERWTDGHTHNQRDRCTNKCCRFICKHPQWPHWNSFRWNSWRSTWHGRDWHISPCQGTWSSRHLQHGWLPGGSGQTNVEMDGNCTMKQYYTIWINTHECDWRNMCICDYRCTRLHMHLHLHILLCICRLDYIYIYIIYVCVCIYIDFRTSCPSMYTLCTWNVVDLALNKKIQSNTCGKCPYFAWGSKSESGEGPSSQFSTERLQLLSTTNGPLDESASKLRLR